jgi:spermidine synthase
LRVVLADAALEIQSDEWRGTVDALQVDLYDEHAAAPVLDTPDFYRHCRDLLSPQGVMTVNLFGRSSSYPASVEKICAAFGEDAVWAFKPTREGNAIVLAQRRVAGCGRAHSGQMGSARTQMAQGVQTAQQMRHGPHCAGAARRLPSG